MSQVNNNSLEEAAKKLREIDQVEFEAAYWESFVNWFEKNIGNLGLKRWTQQRIYENRILVEILSRTVALDKDIAANRELYNELGHLLLRMSRMHRKYQNILKVLKDAESKLPSRLARLGDVIASEINEHLEYGPILTKIGLRLFYSGFRAAAYRSKSRHIAQLALLALESEEDDMDILYRAIMIHGTAQPDRQVPSITAFNALMGIFFDFFDPSADDGGSKIEEPEWEQVATADSLKMGELKDSIVGLWHEVLVANVDGKIHVYENYCTHERDPISYGYILENSIVCRGHHAVFDASGHVKAQPYHGEASSLPQYNFIIKDNAVLVRVPW